MAAHAHPLALYFFGQQQGMGGTSVAAPLWAGLIARINEALGRRVGFINEYVYEQYQLGPGKAAFHDITQGNNACPVTLPTGLPAVPPYYQAAVGWDATTGLGSPRGSALMGLLAAKP